MSGATHTQIPIKQRLLHDRRQAKLIALAAVTAATAMLVALVLALGGGDPPTTENRAAVQAREPSVPQAREPGVRYDGGPEEGTANMSASRPRVAQPPSTRYDGGPEEGTRGAVSSGRPESARLAQQEHPLRSRLGTTQSGAPITSSRYDGGPEEGTRGVLSSKAEPGTRYDSGPEEGSRGSGH